MEEPEGKVVLEMVYSAKVTRKIKQIIKDMDEKDIHEFYFGAVKLNDFPDEEIYIITRTVNGPIQKLFHNFK